MAWFDSLFGGGGAEKDARRNADIANQSQEFISIIEQGLAQLVPGSEEYQKLTAFGQKYLAMIAAGATPVDELGGEVLDQQPAAMKYANQLIQQQQARVASGGAATPQESRTNLSVDQLRQTAAPTADEQGVFQALRGEEPTTELARLYQSLIGTAGRDVTTEFGPAYQDAIRLAGEDPSSLFEPELNLLQDRINREANARGLASSGIPLEKLGRAGVELAIQEAQRREDIRRNRFSDVNQLFQTGESARRNRLSDVNALFDTGQGLRNRSIGLEGDITNLQAGRESRLTDLLNRNSRTSIDDLVSLLGEQSNRAQDTVDVEGDLAESRRQQIADAIFRTAGTAIGGTMGGPPGAAIGNQAGGSVSALLSQQRTTPSTTGQPVNLSQTLNLNPPRRKRLNSYLPVV